MSKKNINIWAALHEKVPNVLSRHTKRRMGRARPSFGMTPTFQKKKKKKNKSKNVKKKNFPKNSKKPVSYQKAIRDLFV